MANSNILDVFKDKEPRDITGEEAKDCLPCQVMGSLGSLAAGVYFSSGYLFKDDYDFKTNPQWWRNTIKGVGYGLIGLGIYRGGQGWLWDKTREYKQVKFLN